MSERAKPYWWLVEKANDQGSGTVIRGNGHLNRGPGNLKLAKWCPGAEFNTSYRRHLET